MHKAKQSSKGGMRQMQPQGMMKMASGGMVSGNMMPGKGTLLSSGKTVMSTHDHLMMEGKKLGFK